MFTKLILLMRIRPHNPFSVEYFVSQATDILRGKVATHDYHVVSLLLFLQKEGVINNLGRLQPHNAKVELFRSVAKLSWVEKNQFRFVSREQQTAAIFDAFQASVNSIDDRTLYYLLQLVESLDEVTLNEFFGQLVESIAYRVAKSEGRFGGEYVQPLELTRFISALASDLPEGARVYNPFAGIASFGVYLKEGLHYSGQEINRLSWAIGMLRLIASNRDSTTDFVIGDSIKDWNPWSESYNLIVSNPPFGLMVSERNNSKASVPIDVFSIKNSLRSLECNGKAILVLSDNILFGSRKDYQLLRKQLVVEDMLEMVISFPGGLLTNTSIPFSLIVINKTNQHKGSVLFIDAEASVREVSKKDKKIDTDSLLLAIKDRSHPDTKLVHKDEIIQNDFILSVNRYLVEELPEINGESLGSIVQVASGGKAGDNVIGKFVRIKDLKTNKQDFLLDPKALEETVVPKQALKLEKSALLLTIRWRTLKPTFFEYKGEPIYVSPDVLACEVNEQKADVAYLVQELSADYVTAQLNRYRTGTTIPYIPKEDLLKVVIELPALRDQRAKITGTALQTLEAERAAIKNQAYEELASIKHSMGKPLLNLNAGVRNIETVLSRLDKEWENIKLSSKNDYTLRDAVNSLFANLNLLSNLLKNNERELDVSTYPLIEMEAIQFFRQYINDLKATDGNKYEPSIDVSPDLLAEFKEGVFIKANEELLKIALNNIVDNAQRHGFTQLGKDYQLELRLSLQLEKDSPFIKVEVANNGAPFPKNFTLEKLVRKASIAGPTGNSGIGGHDIDKIVKWHRGKLDIITDPEIVDPFTTIYEILIPINASNGNK